MKRLLTTALASAAVVSAIVGLTACSSAPAVSSVDISENAILLDVRTPEEFAGGHLEGAELLDFNAGEVQVAIPSLDPDAEYFVYCRSGNRSGQAVTLLEKAGFTSVTNLGSLEEVAQATGISVVTE